MIKLSKVLSVEKHPNADKLVVCQVDIAEEYPLQIVTNLVNIQKGEKIPVALIGHSFSGFTIKQAKIRGVDSYGMFCGKDEIGILIEEEYQLFLSKNEAGKIC